jgi:hypothetical protein
MNHFVPRRADQAVLISPCSWYIWTNLFIGWYCMIDVCMMCVKLIVLPPPIWIRLRSSLGCRTLDSESYLHLISKFIERNIVHFRLLNDFGERLLYNYKGFLTLNFCEGRFTVCIGCRCDLRVPIFFGRSFCSPLKIAWDCWECPICIEICVCRLTFPLFDRRNFIRGWCSIILNVDIWPISFLCP